MLKKISSILVCMLCGVLLTGCNEVINLTDEQSALIAEYAADALLKYDLNYENRIAEGEKEADKLREDEQLTEDITEEKTEEETTEEKTEEAGTSQKEEASDKQTAVGTENDIAKIAGISGVSITYQDYLVTGHYPDETAGDEFVYLDADAGYALLVVRFKVANITEETVDVSLLENGLDYKLVCNGRKAAVPMATILMEDLENLDTSVVPGEDQEAVLVFQIAEDMKDTLDSAELTVNYNNTDYVIKIK